MRLCLDYVLALTLLALPLLTNAHGDEAHDEKPGAEQQVSTSKQSTPYRGESASDSMPPTAATASDANGGNALRLFGDLASDLSLSDFPTLHPLVVHIPVTFIPIAFLFSLLNLFLAHRTFVWLTLGFALVGLLGGFIAAFSLHPHTSGLTEAASVTLQKHDYFAYGTLWLTLAGSLAALTCIWKPIRIVKAGLCALLLLSALAVAITGHYGGTLAYVHGVGVQGQFLSTH
jgi:uncharacterized membrane protein